MEAHRGWHRLNTPKWRWGVVAVSGKGSRKSSRLDDDDDPGSGPGLLPRHWPWPDPADQHAGLSRGGRQLVWSQQPALLGKQGSGPAPVQGSSAGSATEHLLLHCSHSPGCLLGESSLQGRRLGALFFQSAGLSRLSLQTH